MRLAGIHGVDGQQSWRELGTRRDSHVLDVPYLVVAGMQVIELGLDDLGLHRVTLLDKAAGAIDALLDHDVLGCDVLIDHLIWEN